LCQRVRVGIRPVARHWILKIITVVLDILSIIATVKHIARIIMDPIVKTVF
jgi:hypothetical protein